MKSKSCYFEYFFHSTIHIFLSLFHMKLTMDALISDLFVEIITASSHDFSAEVSHHLIMPG